MLDEGIEVNCCVCGGAGRISSSLAGRVWLSEFSHSDPRECAEVLKKKEELKRKTDKLALESKTTF